MATPASAPFARGEPTILESNTAAGAQTKVREDTERERRSPLDFLPLIGLGFWQAWWMCSSTTYVVNGTYQRGVGTVSLILIVTLLGYAAVSLLAPRFAPYSSKRAFVLTGVGGFLGTVLISISTHIDMPFALGVALELTGVVVLALANALLLLMWGERWSTLAAGDVGRQLSVSFAFAFALYFLVSSVPLVVGIALNALFPAVSALSLAVSQRQPCRTETVSPVELRAGPIAIALVSIFVFSLVFGCAQRVFIPRSMMTSLQMLTMTVAGAAVTLMAIWMVTSRGARDPFSFSRPVVAAETCGILLCALLPQDMVYVGNGLVVFGIYCLDMFMMFSASDLAYRSRKPVALVFGVVIVVARTGTLLGTEVGNYLIGQQWFGANETLNTALVLGCALVVVGTLLFTEPHLRALYQNTVKRHAPDLDERCDAIGAAAKLSARELEVMHHLARGRSVAAISESLGIAQGTVKHHASNTYRKLGVYDRQGLIDIVMHDDGESSPDDSRARA